MISRRVGLGLGMRCHPNPVRSSFPSKCINMAFTQCKSFYDTIEANFESPKSFHLCLAAQQKSAFAPNMTNTNRNIKHKTNANYWRYVHFQAPLFFYSRQRQNIQTTEGLPIFCCERLILISKNETKWREKCNGESLVSTPTSHPASVQDYFPLLTEIIDFMFWATFMLPFMLWEVLQTLSCIWLWVLWQTWISWSGTSRDTWFGFPWHSPHNFVYFAYFLHLCWVIHNPLPQVVSRLRINLWVSTSSGTRLELSLISGLSEANSVIATPYRQDASKVCVISRCQG